jgi:ribosomal protein L1
LLQTVFLANDQDIHLWLSDPKTSWTVEVAQKFGWPTTSTSRRSSEKLQQELEQMVEKYQQNSKDRKELQQIKAFAKKNNLSDQLKRLLEMDGNDANETAEVSSTITVEQADWIVENAYLRTLSRLPKETEKSTAVAYLTSEAKPISAIQSLMWSLVNTKEFILNH